MHFSFLIFTRKNSVLYITLMFFKMCKSFPLNLAAQNNGIEMVSYNYSYTHGKKEIHPNYISPIKMRSLWMEIKYVKSAARLLDRNWVNKGGLDLSKKVLWVSVVHRAAQLQAVKFGGQQKILPISPVRTHFARA